MANDTRPLSLFPTEDLLRIAAPTEVHEECNAASADYIVVNQNCRAMYADTDGIIKFDYIDNTGATKTEVASTAALPPLRRVTKIYRYYKDTTACTAKIYTSAGAEVVGVKLRS